MKKPFALSLAAFGLLGSPVQSETIFGVTISNQLISFDSTAPVALGSVPISGLVDPFESVIGIDFRPANHQLYALGNALGNAYRLYTINIITGAATQVGTGTLAGNINGSSFGFDFSPTADVLRVVNDAEQNLRYDPNDASLVATDSSLAYNIGDANFMTNPTIGGAAYTNAFVGATTTTLYNIDYNFDVLTIQNPPNAGTMTTVGLLGVNFFELVGFDISGLTGTAFASSSTPTGGNSQLYTINLGTGVATLIGNIGQNLIVRDIAAFVPIPEPAGLGLIALCWVTRRRRR
jgi:Domain of unknown function (DUF4394)